jgi:adenylate cyclase
MAGDAAERAALQQLQTAVAVVAAETWALSFENGRFFQWFPPDGSEDEPLDRRVRGFDATRASERLARGRAYTFETQTTVAGRELPVRVRVEALENDAAGRLLVECSDVSKEMEVQYMLDSYSQLAEHNARDLEREKERVERLLLNIMPRSVLDEMKEFGTITPQRFDDVSILMLDFVGFTSMAISQDAGAVITELNDIFSAFDRIVDMLNCERLKTIGDAYIAVAGVPQASPEHPHNIARLALRMRRYLERRNSAHPQTWHARIGIATGSVIGSLVGIQKYVYDLFGPGMNLAARMEAASEPMRITVSEDTYQRLKDDFVLTPRGQLDVKGFGLQNTYFLEGEVGRGR